MKLNIGAFLIAFFILHPMAHFAGRCRQTVPYYLPPQQDMVGLLRFAPPVHQQLQANVNEKLARKKEFEEKNYAKIFHAQVSLDGVSVPSLKDRFQQAILLKPLDDSQAAEKLKGEIAALRKKEQSIEREVLLAKADLAEAQKVEEAWKTVRQSILQKCPASEQEMLMLSALASAKVDLPLAQKTIENRSGSY